MFQNLKASHEIKFGLRFVLQEITFDRLYTVSNIWPSEIQGDKTVGGFSVPFQSWRRVGTDIDYGFGFSALLPTDLPCRE